VNRLGRSRLSTRGRLELAVQRNVSWVLAPVWTTLCWLLLVCVGRYRIEEVGAARREYRRIRAECPGPLLVCANHLTLLDSALVAWALGSPLWFWMHFRALPWNVPEARNFAGTRLLQATTWLLKCVPIERGGDRREVGAVLKRLGFLLSRGDAVLLFPEGGRSRSGRVDREARTYGVGRLLSMVPGSHVLCVHLRGLSQETWSDRPRRGERFRVELALFEPKSDARGLRRSVDLSRQVLSCLADLEARHFAGIRAIGDESHAGQ
jgi:hypothetical protein